MAQQPNLFPPKPPDGLSKPVSSASVPFAQGTEAQEGRGSNWLRRLEILVHILVRLYLGLLLLLLPWLSFWSQNNLFTYDPMLLAVATNGFVRGMVSGLGLLNVLSAAFAVKQARLARVFQV